jgi:hypothetical protein
MAKDPQNPDFEIDPNWEPPSGEAPKVKELETPDPVLELKAQLDRERAARADAERRANEYAQSAHSSKNEVADTQMQLVVSAIERVKEQRALIRSAKAQAAAAGDWDAVAQLDEQMADEAAKLLQLENGKAAMEAQPKPQAPRPILDPVEALASQLTARSAAWVRAHPECARDQRLYQKMIAAHNLAVANDIEPDSDEYFRSVEQAVFNRKPNTAVDNADEDDPMAAAAKAAPPRAAAPMAAPVSHGGTNGRSVRLSPAEREAAEMSGMTDQEYAVAREEMRKAGRIH